MQVKAKSIWFCFFVCCKWGEKMAEVKKKQKKKKRNPEGKKRKGDFGLRKRVGSWVVYRPCVCVCTFLFILYGPQPAIWE